MTNIFTIIGSIIGAALVALSMAIWSHISPPLPEPVSVNVRVVDLKRYPDRVEVMLEWENRRNCEFSSLSTMQGSFDYPDDLRTPVERDLGPPKGPRGIGQQATVDPWVFYRPGTIHGPNFIMTAWHKCGGESVPSVMLVVDIRDWFPE